MRAGSAAPIGKRGGYVRLVLGAAIFAPFSKKGERRPFISIIHKIIYQEAKRKRKKIDQRDQKADNYPIF